MDAFTLILTNRSVHLESIEEADTSPFVARASRFRVQLEVRYRMVGDPQWRLGHTRNASRSGILFHADTPIPAATDLEIELVLPGTAVGEPHSRLHCAGHTVRMTDDAPPCVAATVGDYQLATV
jgi:hypothetical protein